MIYIKVHVLLTSSNSVQTEERRPAQGHHVGTTCDCGLGSDS